MADPNRRAVVRPGDALYRCWPLNDTLSQCQLRVLPLLSTACLLAIGSILNTSQLNSSLRNFHLSGLQPLRMAIGEETARCTWWTKTRILLSNTQ